MEVKIFTKAIHPKVKRGFWSSASDSVSSSDEGLEGEINIWLATNPDIEIKNITQSQSGGSLSTPSTIVVSVWYQK